MLYTIGFDEIIKNIYVLSGRYKEKIQTTQDLKEAYLLFLRDFQSLSQVSSGAELFLMDEEQEEKLTAHFRKPSILEDRGGEFSVSDRLDPISKKKKKQQVEDALKLIEKLSPDYKDIFDLAIHTLFFRDSEKSIGGSVKSCLGVIWANPSPSWDPIDVAEFLIHELVHNLIFLDEIRYQHYVDYKELQRPENLVISAILEQERPLDKVLHSAIVGVEILWSRLKFLPFLEKPRVHFVNSVVLEKLERSLLDIRKIPHVTDLMTERGLFLLNRCEELFQEGKKRVGIDKG